MRTARAVLCVRAQLASRAQWSSSSGAAVERQPAAKPTEKIAKRLSMSGVCSRRVGEEWILNGRISVDGKVVRDPAVRILASQKVTVDGEEAKAGPMRLWVHNKKPGVTVTERDSHAEIPLIPTLQKLGLPRLLAIGRLDINSEGLLLLTNHGELKQALERSSVKRKYRVRVRGVIPSEMIDQLRQGVTVEGVHYAPIEMSIPSRSDAMRNQWIDVTLQEGKNREIRRIMHYYGLQISRLIRTHFASYTLDGLEAGATREVEIKSLVRRWVKKLRDGQLDLRTVHALDKQSRHQDNDAEIERDEDA